MGAQGNNEPNSSNTLDVGSKSLAGRSLATLAVLGVMLSCAFGIAESISPMDYAATQNAASNEIALPENNSSEPDTNSKTDKNAAKNREEDASSHSKIESEAAGKPQEEQTENRLAENEPLTESAETQQTQEQDSEQVAYAEQSSEKTSGASEHQNDAAESIPSEPASQPSPAPDPEPAPESEPAPAPEPEPAPVQANISVSISVSSDAVGSPVSGSTMVSLPQGATAYDALMASGFAVDTRNTVYGLYVAGIGGLAEKQHGGASGWLYAVNGVTPGQSAASYVLNDGDAVSWFYTT